MSTNFIESVPGISPLQLVLRPWSDQASPGNPSPRLKSDIISWKNPERFKLSKRRTRCWAASANEATSITLFLQWRHLIHSWWFSIVYFIFTELQKTVLLLSNFCWICPIMNKVAFAKTFELSLNLMSLRLMLQLSNLLRVVHEQFPAMFLFIYIVKIKPVELLYFCIILWWFKRYCKMRSPRDKFVNKIQFCTKVVLALLVFLFVFSWRKTCSWKLKLTINQFICVAKAEQFWNLSFVKTYIILISVLTKEKKNCSSKQTLFH